MRFGIAFALSRLSRFALSRRAIRRLADLGALRWQPARFRRLCLAALAADVFWLMAVAVSGNRAARDLSPETVVKS